jgi:hypothetical protein
LNVIPHTVGLKPTSRGNLRPMTKGTSDEEDQADYTDDHREERRIDRPGPKDMGGKGGMATREVAPDVAKPEHEPPD